MAGCEPDRIDKESPPRRRRRGIECGTNLSDRAKRTTGVGSVEALQRLHQELKELTLLMAVHRTLYLLKYLLILVQEQ